MRITTEHERLSPCLPRPAGEVPAQRAEGAPSSPNLTSQLSPAMLEDLLDPTNTPLQICQIHNITLHQLAHIMDSDAYHQSAAAIKRITHQRQDLINDHTQLQTQSLQRAIAHDAYLAATDMDQATTSRDPKRAAIKSRYLETARKANAPLDTRTPDTHDLGARTRGKAAQCGRRPPPPIPTKPNKFPVPTHKIPASNAPSATNRDPDPDDPNRACVSIQSGEKEMKIAISTIALAATMSTAGIVNTFDEAVLGDFSDDRFAPTALDFTLGSNIVTNNVVDSGTPGIGDRDYYTFSLTSGQSIDSITLIDASNPAGGFDAIAFVGIAFDSIFDYDPDTFSGPGLEGFILTTPDLIGGNVITELSGGLSSLGEGDYSLWIQQTGSDLTSLSLNYNVIPAPTTGAILATMGVIAARRRR